MRRMCTLPRRRALTARLVLSAGLLLSAGLPLTVGLSLISEGARASDTARVATSPSSATTRTTRLSHGRFRDFLVYSPSGPPTSFVLFLSGDEGWTAAAEAMAGQLVQHGAMVVGID